MPRRTVVYVLSLGSGLWWGVSWAYGLAGCGILVKASLVSGRDLAAYLLSLVSIWRTLLSQGEYWFKTRVQA